MNLLFGLLISLMLIYIGALIFEKRNIGIIFTILGSGIFAFSVIQFVKTDIGISMSDSFREAVLIILIACGLSYWIIKKMGIERAREYNRKNLEYRFD